MATAATEPAPRQAQSDEGVKLDRSQRAAMARCGKALATYGEVKKRMAAIAKAVVDMRLTFQKDGHPDVRGESAQYRGAIASVYEKHIPDPEERSAFKVAIRYWVSKEWASRVESGAVAADLLETNGITKPTRAPAARSVSPATDTLRSVKELMEVVGAAPPEMVIEEVEKILTDNLDKLSPMVVLGSIERELTAVVAELRHGISEIPPRAFKRVSQAILEDALSLADLAGVEVPALVREYQEEALSA